LGNDEIQKRGYSTDARLTTAPFSQSRQKIPRSDQGGALARYEHHLIALVATRLKWANAPLSTAR